MASLLQPLFILFLLNHFLILPTHSHQTFLLNLTKDPQTHQYTTNLLISTLHLPTKLILHLSGHSLWVNCHPSTTHITSSSIQCLLTKSNGHKTSPLSSSSTSNLCHLHEQNPFTGETNVGYLVKDMLSVNGMTVDDFLFSCSKEYLVNGVLGFGRSKIGFWNQMVNSFGFVRKFSLCLSSSDGFIMAGDTYRVYKSLAYYYTPLVSNSMSKQHGYYVNVNWIKVNGKRLVVGQPIGVVEISSTVPYTVVKSEVYEVLRKSFVTAASAMNVSLVSPVAPFGVCFRSQVNVPDIELVMQSELVKWRIQRRNSMVEVSDSVMCLGFVDGGLGMTVSMILGGHQLEDRLMEFDLGTGMMGFSSSLSEGESCANIGASFSRLRESL